MVILAFCRGILARIGKNEIVVEPIHKDGFESARRRNSECCAFWARFDPPLLNNLSRLKSILHDALITSPVSQR